jgi:hypothetical protein
MASSGNIGIDHPSGPLEFLVQERTAKPDAGIRKQSV